MRSDELRQRYLEFFQKKDHTLFPSDSLVPEGDASVLFTGAGMNQFKDAFLGKGPPGLKRATSIQKCLRMPDLDNVGRTPSHHTFFEMLGNFSFGDYFKSEAIAWAVEFLEQELGLPRDKLAITVYLDDDEAAEIWEKEAGFAKDRIWRCGEEDNFWPAEAPSKGPNGPCGPCSEIYFDFGESASTVKNGESTPANDSGRFVEIWNLVFTQFERVGVNDLKPLPRKNIDTGAGFERMVRVLQDKPNNFETDLFVPIIERIGTIAECTYGRDPAVDVRIKRIADHIRAATFCIGDGVRPSNEGRGYVVRKVIRRAGMDLLELGRDDPGLAEVVPAVVDVMGDAYPDLREREGLLRETVAGEEERFAEVYVAGTEKLRVMLARSTARTLSGEDAFFLWDTIGFPFDITVRFCQEQGFAVDTQGFERQMEGQRDRARKGSRIAADIFSTGPAGKLKGQIEATRFTGYQQLEETATVVAMLDARGERIDAFDQTDGEVTVVLDRTPCYAESGGQVGDMGRLSPTGSGIDLRGRIEDTAKAEEYHLHRVVLEAGRLTVGGQVVVTVDAGRRQDIMRNHTATHLLHWALRKVAGEETTQAGSLVHPDYLRFDYTSAKALSAEALETVEDLVNGQVLKSLGVDTDETDYDSAREQGAMALFGEKYGSDVRVVKVLDQEPGRGFDSVELCGGTHCASTGQIGSFQIVSDSAISAGVRRIIAVTGRGALALARQRLHLTRGLSQLVKSPEDELIGRVDSLLKEKSRLEKEIARGRKQAAATAIDELIASKQDLDGVSLYTQTIEEVGQPELRALADQLAKKDPAAVILLFGVEGQKINVVVASATEAVKKGVLAGDLCKLLGQELGGGGGGRPDMAQGQGRNRQALGQAVERAEARIRETTGSAAD